MRHDADAGVWVRCDRAKTGVDIPGMHLPNGTINPTRAQESLAIALAGSIVELVFRGQPLPEMLSIATIIAQTDICDTAHANEALCAMQGDAASAIASVATKVYSDLAKRKEQICDAAALVLDWAMDSVERPQRRGTRIEAGASDLGPAAWVQHGWEKDSVLIRIYRHVRAGKTQTGESVYIAPQHDGRWRVASVPGKTPGLHLNDVVECRGDTIATPPNESGFCRTIRALTQHALRRSDFDDLAGAGAIVAEPSDEGVTIIAQVPDVPKIRGLLERASWAGLITVE